MSKGRSMHNEQKDSVYLLKMKKTKQNQKMKNESTQREVSELKNTIYEAKHFLGCLNSRWRIHNKRSVKLNINKYKTSVLKDRGKKWKTTEKAETQRHERWNQVF